MGKIGVFQFLGIGRTDGRHRICGKQGALEQIHITGKSQRTAVKPAAGKAEKIFQRFAAVAPLVLNIMHGKHRSDTAQHIPAHSIVRKIDGHQGRLPVIAVNHFRHKVQMRQQ